MDSNIDFDDDGTPRSSNMNNSVDYLNNSDTSSTHRSDTDFEEEKVAGTSIEMVDLSKKNDFVMKEFQVSNKVNQSQKKREKRKIKKEKELSEALV